MGAKFCEMSAFSLTKKWIPRVIKQSVRWGGVGWSRDRAQIEIRTIGTSKQSNQGRDRMRCEQVLNQSAKNQTKIYKYSNIQVFKYSSIQVLKYSSIIQHLLDSQFEPDHCALIDTAPEKTR
jgi:hypothetical protein